jgi:FMN phosphatase YigB (HAD superfamily)
MQTVIFDIDGTLADNWHRQHLVQKDKPDWDEFFEKMSEDTLNKPVAALYELVRNSGQYKTLLVSARPERYREMTEFWFADQGLSFEMLYMREDGDRRPDYQVKKEMLDKILADGHEILFVVDDRTQTVNMWRENGITCLQCAEHDF